MRRLDGSQHVHGGDQSDHPDNLSLLQLCRRKLPLPAQADPNATFYMLQATTGGAADDELHTSSTGAPVGHFRIQLDRAVADPFPLP